jgi:aspartyl-tRNA(Asn)/glutamyl-tRNA(Gln) amidotransferase subunit B
MRSKEEAHDYRYFPDPDLLPLEFDQAFIDDLKAHLPELPDAKKVRFIAEYGLSAYDAGVLVAERETADCYEREVKHRSIPRDAKAVANLMMGDVSAYANAQSQSVKSAMDTVGPGFVADLVDLIDSGEISGKIAKEVFTINIAEGGKLDARWIVEARGLRQVTDVGEIERAVDAIIAANPDKVAQAIAKPTMLGWFVGQVMKSTGGKANPQAVNAVLKDRLGLR